MTLIELVIYIALFAIVTLFLGRIFKSLVTNYNSGTSLVRQQTDMRDILGLMAREIRNTGLKVYLTGTGPYTKNIDNRVVVQPGVDLSSFYHAQSSAGQYGDTLKIMKIVLDNNGDFETADTNITYYLDGTTLRRQLKTTDAWIKQTNSVVAENVHALQFEYGILKSDNQLFDQDPIEAGNWNLSLGVTNPTKSGTTELSLAFSGTAEDNLQYNYIGFSGYPVEQNQKYRVIMDVSTSGGFPAALDYLSIIFKNGSGTELGSEQFRPYGGPVDIIVPIHTTGTMFPYLGYKTTGSGNVTISTIKVSLEEQKEYTWSFNPAAADKKNVRAIRIYILVRSKNDGVANVSGPITVGDVDVPRTGSYSWRLYTETVEIPNNGVF